MLLFLLAFLAGCSYNDGHGTRHTLVFGFGMISVNSTNQNLATVTKVTGIGLNASTSPGRGGLGYFNSTLIEVKTDTNLVIEVKDFPGSPIYVNIP